MHHSTPKYIDLIVRAGVSLDERQLGLLEQYATLLREWNARVNLVSRKDEANLWPAHILHSLSPLISLRIPDGTRIADLGSGGGLPGIPLAIALPQVNLVLIESIRKKCVALEDMIRQLRLFNVSVLNARAENAAGMREYKSSFDMVIARAVAPLEDLLDWSSPLVRHGRKMMLGLCGKESSSLSFPALVAMKGGSLDEEVKSVKKAKVKFLRTVPIEFEGIKETGLEDKVLIIIGL